MATPEGQYLLSIDNGTQSIRAMVFDRDGARLRHRAREQRRADGTLIGDDDLLVAIDDRSVSSLRDDIRGAVARRAEAKHAREVSGE